MPPIVTEEVDSPITSQKELENSQTHSASAPELSSLIDQLGYGPAQVAIVLIAGSVWAADGAETMTITNVVKATADEWHMGPHLKGSIASLVFVGLMIGNAVSGTVGDRMGRRKPLIYSYFFIVVFSCISALSWNPYVLGVVRLFVGMAIGLGQPTCMSIVSEFSPTEWRYSLGIFAQSLWTVGEMWTIVVLWVMDPTLEHLEWRILLCLGAIPAAILFVVSSVFLTESPYFLACMGRRDSVTRVLGGIQRANHSPDVDISSFKVSERDKEWTLGEQLRVVGRNGRLLFSTLALSFVCLSMNLSWYGTAYAFPQIIGHVGFDTSPVATLMIGVLWEIPGMLLGFLFGRLWPRKVSLAINVGIQALAFYGFGQSASMPSKERTWAVQTVLYVSYSMIKVEQSTVGLMLYQFIPEIYPSNVRVLGSGLILSMGRLGAVVSSIVYEFLKVKTGSFEAFFYLTGFFSFVSMFLMAVPPETKGLAFTLGEQLPLKKDQARV